jgi:hypothetical protein
MGKQKLQLTWIGKDKLPIVSDNPVVLIASAWGIA